VTNVDSKAERGGWYWKVYA